MTTRLRAHPASDDDSPRLDEGHTGPRRGARLAGTLALGTLVSLLVLAGAIPIGVSAEQASEPSSPAAAQLDAGQSHSCAVVGASAVRCWGFGADGQLGYGNSETVGDDEAPGSRGPVNLGQGARAISAGGFHSCAVLEDQSVRCWGSGIVGQLGYGTSENIGDNEPPGSMPPVDLGSGRSARAISAGHAHTCAVLDNGSVRCWGYGGDGRVGYPELFNLPSEHGSTQLNVGDKESPAAFGPVDLGDGHGATAISAGESHTCAILDDASVRCWGSGTSGRLGYGDQQSIGDDEPPGSAGPVDLGANRSARAISAGERHTCAILDDASVRCWGSGFEGRLGYGDSENIGDDEPPGSVPPVDLGPERSAKAISAGLSNTCALLDNGAVRCWGYGGTGQLGSGNSNNIGDDETPGSVAPVDLGPGRRATAISVGERHSCARLDDASVRCWGYAGNGRLGYCNDRNIGDDETPGSVGPIMLATPPGGGSGCSVPSAGSGPTAAPPPFGSNAGPADPLAAALHAEATRLRGLRSCRTQAARHARRELRRARGMSGARRARAMRHIKRHRSQLRRRCLKRFGRTPGRVTGLKARAVSARSVVLSFNAAGSDGARPPAARAYLVKQSRRPIRSSRAFRRAQTLCRGSCRFPVSTRVGGEVTLTVGDLLPRTTYYYAVAARDNVSRKLGPRSSAVRVRTR